MSQPLLTYTLPNGTQVLIQPVNDKEAQIFPLVFWDDEDDNLFEDNSSTSILLPELEIIGNNEGNVMDSTPTLETNLPAQNILNVASSHGNIVSDIDGHCVFESTMGTSEIGSDLDKVIGVQQDLNSIICVGNNVENESVDNGISQLVTNNEHNDLKDVTFDNIIQKNFLTEICDTNASAKNEKMLENTSNITTEICINSPQVDANLVNITLDDNIKPSSCVSSIGDDCSVQNADGIVMSEATPQACHIAEATSTESILEQACQSVPLTMEDGDLKNHQLGSPSDSVILDHLDEFAEMVMLYKCRICRYAAGNREDLLEHLRVQHLEGNLDSDHLLNGDGVSSTDLLSILPGKRDVCEKLVYLCAQCTLAFASIEECREHMMQDHELILHENGEDQSNSINPDTSESSCIKNAEPLVAVKDLLSKLWAKPEEEAVQTNKKSCSLLKRKEPGFLSNSKIRASAPKLLSKRYLLTKKPMNLKCPVRGCPSKFNDLSEIEIHTSCHVTGQRGDPKEAREKSHEFVCCKCPMQFERWRLCAAHLWRVHNVDCGLLACPICLKYKTTTSVQLENHMRIHGEDRSFTCGECGKGFKQSAQLHNHRIVHFDRRATDPPKWYASQQCGICFKNYADSKCLKKHIQAVHRKLRPYVCQVCGHASARKAMLQLHLRQHTGEKPHSCPLCEYKTGDHNSLRRHVMRHTGQKQYQCPHCPYSAIQSNSYKNHLRSKHPGQAGLFMCPHCPFRTVSLESFQLHLSDHRNGVIAGSADGSGSDEVFPGNVAAAELIYSCLNALSKDGSEVEANVTGSSTSADGTTQTITIQIPSQEQTNEDDEATGCFLQTSREEEVRGEDDDEEDDDDEEEDESIDTGGITIPAEPEQSMICHVSS